MNSGTLKVLDTADFSNKPKRGRPKKNLQTVGEPVEDQTNVTIVQKKRGRKKKVESDLKCLPIPEISKSYIIQLKIGSNDLNKIQERFMRNNCDDYFNVINDMELPQTMTSISNVPNIYSDVVLPVLAGNLPIKLLDKYDNTCVNMSNYRKTGNIMMPVLKPDSHKWPEKSPYACWNCDSYFTGTPIGIPDKTHGEHFYCYGNFCCFECAGRYLIDNEKDIDTRYKYSLLCRMHQIAFDLPPDSKVVPAPPRQLLSKYGGNLSYEEYHQTHQCNKIYEIYKLPLIPVLMHIGEMYKTTNIENIMKSNTKQTLPTQKKQIYIPLVNVNVSGKYI